MKKAIPISLSKRKSTLTTPQMDPPTTTVKEQEPSTVVATTSTLKAAGIPDPLHSYVIAT